MEEEEEEEDGSLHDKTHWEESKQEVISTSESQNPADPNPAEHLTKRLNASAESETRSEDADDEGSSRAQDAQTFLDLQNFPMTLKYKN